MARGTLRVRIIGDSAPLERTLGGLGSKLATVGKVAGAAVAAGFGTSLALGFGRLRAIDDAQFKLQGLGHDAATVEKIMGSALDSVKGTSFGLGDAASIAASAVAAGVAPGEELTRTLSLTGDAASIAGVSLGEMGSIFGKVGASNRMMTDELNQMTDRGIPMLQWLADEFGVTAAEARDMVSDGVVDFATFQKVIEENIGGAALTAGESFSGAFANMGAALGRFGAQLLDPLFAAGPNIFGKITEALDVMAGRVAPVAEAFAAWVSGALSALGDWWSENGPQIVASVQAIAREIGAFVSGALAAFSAWWSENGPSIIDSVQRIAAVVVDVLVAAFDKLSDWWDDNGGTVMSAVETLADGVVTAFSRLADAAEFVRDNWDRIWPALRAVGAVIVTLLIPHYVALGVAATVSAAKNVAAWALKSTAAVRHGATILVSFGRIVAGWVLMGAQALIQAAKMAAAWVLAMGPVGWVIAAVVALVALIVANWDTVVDWTRRAWTWVTQAVSRAWTAVTGFVSRGVARVVGFFSNLGTRIRNLATGLFRFYVNIWVTIISTVVGAVVGFVSRVVGFFTSIRDRISTAATGARTRVVEAFVRLVSGVTSRITSLVTLVTGIPGRILRALGNTGRMLFNAGKNVISGLIDGVRSMIGNVGTAISDAAAQVTRFWPFSPAKEGPLRKYPPEKAGANIVGMMAAGMAANVGQIAAQADAAARAALIPMLDQTGEIRAVTTTGLSTSGPASRTSADETNRLLRELLAEMRRGGDVYLDGDRVGRSMVKGIQATQGGWRT